MFILLSSRRESYSYSTQVSGTKAAEFDPEAQALLVIQPFMPGMFSHGNLGAWPPGGSSNPTLCPMFLQCSWFDPRADVQMHELQTDINADLVSSFANYSHDVGSLPLYPNYARFDTPIEAIYGSNLPRLQELKAIYDPEDVMGLAGGFKIPLPAGRVKFSGNEWVQKAFSAFEPLYYWK